MYIIYTSYITGLYTTYYHTYYHRLQAELQAGKVLFRNAFATQRAGGLLYNAMDTYVKNTANTNVVCWGGRCLALFEVGV